MRKTLFLIYLLGTTCALWSQSNPSSWANLNTLQTGEKVEVQATSSKRVSGTFLSVSDAAISVQDKAGPQTMQRQDVHIVKRMKNKHRLRNMLIVAGVGAGAGAVIGAATHKSCPSQQSFCLDIGGAALPAAVFAVLGGLGGAVVGALLPSHSTIYLASSH